MPWASSNRATCRLAVAPKASSGRASAVASEHRPVAPLRGQPARGHQRQLVGRQAPERAGGDGERDRPRRRPQRLADRGGVAAAAEGEGAGNGADGLGARRHEQQVVADPRPGGHHRGPRLGVDAREGVADEAHVLVGREAREVHAPGLVGAEGLEHGERPVLEAVAGRDHVDAQLLLGEEGAQGEARLERGDAATGDEDPRAVVGLGRGLGHQVTSRRSKRSTASSVSAAAVPASSAR